MMLQRVRNDCAHRSYKPDPRDAAWYVDMARKSAEDFSLKELGVDIREREVTESKSTTPTPEILHQMNAKRALREGRVMDAILTASVLLDLLLSDYSVSKGLSPKYAKRQALLEFIRKRSKDLPVELVKAISQVRVVRGEIVKGRLLPTKEDAQFVVETVDLISQKLSETWTRENRCSICGNASIVLKREERDGKVIKFYCETHARA